VLFAQGIRVQRSRAGNGIRTITLSKEQKDQRLATPELPDLTETKEEVF
jgi:hypothetical protein